MSYRESMDQDVLMRAQMDIRTAFPGQADNFRPRLVFVATWDSVGYFDRHLDKVQSIVIELSRHSIAAPPPDLNDPLSCKCSYTL